MAAEPFIFISYSRKDAVYVQSLIQKLENYGLQVWLDNNIDYGTRWSREIEDHLERCGIFILVMSSNSKNSEWVQNELLYVKPLNKPIFPILLEGKLWLEVQTIQCVDVINNELPPEKFFQRVSAALQSSSGNSSTKTLNSADNLSSERFEANYYAKLRDLLEAKDWKAADQETAKRMLEVMDRQEEGWLNVEHIDKFPCQDLRNIDQLWMKYSNDKFGFSIQKQIWQDCGSPKIYNQDWERFGVQLGWKEGEVWLSYSQLTFDDRRARRGHLPLFEAYVCRTPLGYLLGGRADSACGAADSGMCLSSGVVGRLFSRVKICRL